MSDKKSKSKSKQKSQKGKDSKSKKVKDDKDDKKSKKSVDKGSKKEKGSKKDDLNKSKISKPEDNQSQDLSMFKPLMFNQPLPNVDESVCPFHNEKNTIFCQVSQQTGCQNCLLYGPLNSQMHRISKLDQSFKARYLYLNEIVCGDLLAKRDLLNKKLEQLTLLSDQLRYVKNGIEKMTKIQYNEMMQRLNTNAGHKFAILNHQMASLQRDLQSINSLGNQFFELTNMNPQSNSIPETNPHKGMVPFLLRSKFLQQQAQQLISKPIKTSIDVYPYDLPRQLTEKKLILDKNKGALDLLKVKDETIWMLLQQKKLMNQQLWQGFYEQAREQAGQWQKLNSKLRNQLETFNMRCSKCGIVLDQNNVNQQCQKGQYHYFLT